ncbi:hypothetical protein [Deefgea rivuli]|uniref:hypothetical protein n=1 Tax=Deefgea rivuli TaxID=400948 RepID=UPI0004889E5C|nr:hypothetical protein [Deefgea rivuli]
MPKYQFFKLEQAKGDNYRWLAMAEDSFLVQKEQLLSRGFEVIGDVIYAETEQEAVRLFNSGMTYPLQEYNLSSPMGGLVYAVKALAESARDRLSKKT